MTPAGGHPAADGVVAVKGGPPPLRGLVRERLTGLVAARVVLVGAPAGHGKSTLLAQLADLYPGPVVWYRVDGDDRDEAALLARLGPALLAVTGQGPADGREGRDALADAPGLVARLVAAPPAAQPAGGALLVVDDVHLVAGTPGGRALVAVVAGAPGWLQVLLAGRDDHELETGLDAAVAGVRRVGPEDLRFRAWEVERLFREVYRRPLPPEDAAALTARTEGWAAGLTMFDLLTRGRSPAQRHAAVADLARASRLVRGYLVREVLSALPPDLRTFLRVTSALGVLTGAACDALLGTTGSQAVLEGLERRQLFTTADAQGLRFRYHQVLQDHLELELTEELGHDGAREVYRRAGALLLDDGDVWAAFRAYARAQDWGRVRTLLAARGADIAGRPDAVLAEPLPAGLRDRDPWLVLAAARVLAAHGSIVAALGAYARAAALTEDPDVRDLCLHERRSLSIWVAGGRPPTTTPSGLLRAATQHGPARFAEPGATPGIRDLLAAGAAALLAGDLEPAAALFARAGAAVGPDRSSAVLATAGLACADLIRGGARGPGAAGQPGDEVESLLPAALVRLVVGAGAAAETDLATLSVLADEADADDDSWGAALLRLLAGLAGSPSGLAAAEETFAVLEAPVLVHWARCVRLLADKADAAPGALVELGREGRALGAPGVVGAVRALLERHSSTPAAPPAPAVEQRLRVRLFGGFDVSVDDTLVDLGGVRPRVRALVQLLALRAGTFVHRDVLAATLWPEADLETGRRGVQVAVSALRGLLQPGYRRQSTLLPRRGDAYALVLPAGGGTDVGEFERLLVRARRARAGGDEQGAVRAWAAAVALYRGELLPEQGSAEWVVADRDRLRVAAADALEGLGRALLRSGSTGEGAGQGAVEAAVEGVDALRRSLELDPFRDTAWRALITAHETSGDLAAAAEARRRHRRVLADLGVLEDSVPGLM